MYVNGKRITAFDSTSYPDQDLSTQWNRAQVNYMGSRAGGNYYDGYLADVHLIDGQQLSANYFGEPDPDNPNTWAPKKYNGTFGAQGSLHEFGNTGTGSGANKFEKLIICSVLSTTIIAPLFSIDVLAISALGKIDSLM